MRHRATHLLHVIACAPVTAALVVTLALPVHARTASPSQQPKPFVVAIDPGHGGSPDNTRPDQLFDPGVIAADGLEEKDVTLDVARRLAALLRADAVEVVLTRTDDSYVDIGPRMQSAIDAGAQLFLSIHFNSFTDASTGGALILYPNDDSLAFAQVMSDALAARLQQYGIANDGVQNKADLWVHATMPAVTVEGGYLTNPREADLLTQNGFRDALAQAIRDGVEKQAPQIATLATRIRQWQAAHRTPAPAPHTAGIGALQVDTTSAGATLLRWAVMLAVLAALVRWRRRVVVAARWALGVVADGLDPPTKGQHRPRHGRRRTATGLGGHTLTLATSARGDTPLSRRLPQSQRRRRSARRRAVLDRAARPAPTRRSVYDELWF